MFPKIKEMGSSCGFCSGEASWKGKYCKTTFADNKQSPKGDFCFENMQLLT